MAKSNTVKAASKREQVKCGRCGVPFSHFLHERLEVSGPNGNVSIHAGCRSKGEKVVDSQFFGDTREEEPTTGEVVAAAISEAVEAAPFFKAVNSIARGEA